MLLLLVAFGSSSLVFSLFPNIQLPFHKGLAQMLLVVASACVPATLIFTITPFVNSLGKYYRERIDRDGCGINGKITISGGKASKVSVRGSGCTVLVSATKGSGAALSGVPTQNYGGDATAMVKGSGSFGV